MQGLIAIHLHVTGVQFKQAACSVGLPMELGSLQVAYYVLITTHLDTFSPFCSNVSRLLVE